MANLAEMIAISGATARQIDHWTRCGYLVADEATPGPGYPRNWHIGELAVVRLLRRLTEAGLQPAVAAQVARGARELAPGIFIFINGDGE